ncbi:MAG: type I-C CRISPR-associated protein Cas8c/Csd1 [Candidatus Firestonebacteria bacterium]
MSWIQKLYETYENCQSMIGNTDNENEVPLLPICHTTQKAHIEIVIDVQGNFKRARVVSINDARTIIPCTESSGGRTSGESPHPLCDKLQYIAKDYVDYYQKKKDDKKNKKPKDYKIYHDSYKELLEQWCNSNFSHQKAKAVLKFITKGNVIENLIAYKILVLGEDEKLLKKWDGTQSKKTDLFNRIKGTEWQQDAFVRWEVEVSNDPCSKVWEDKTLWDSWMEYYKSTKNTKTLCYVTGKELFATDMHSAKLRNDGDKAKIISSNDWDGFTFRGRFNDSAKNNRYQTCGVGFEITQKAHNTLRWLISRQGYKGDPTIVSWAISGKQTPDLRDDSLSFLGEEEFKEDDVASDATAQIFALKLKNKIAGYKAELGNTERIVVMGLDSATPGRMAITFYRELTGSEFLERVENWHESCKWAHNYRYIDVIEGNKKIKKYISFVGAPAPKDIAEAAYGSKSDEKIKKATVERILPCIIDGLQISRDIVESAVRRASNRGGLEKWEWKKTLSIACALYKKYKEKEGYDMALDENRKTRDYLYGRLLALADNLEQWALESSGEKRQTNAARLMQRFSDHPYSTWRTIELSLSPYKARLGKKSKKQQENITEVVNMFAENDFTSDKKLSGEYLLGYHCQLAKIGEEIEISKSKKKDNNTEETQ